MTVRGSEVANTGAPESPVQAPNPPLAARTWIEQANLETARLPGHAQRGGAYLAAGASITTHRDPVAGDQKAIADRDRFLRLRENGRGEVGRLGQLEQGDVGGCPMPQQCLEVELRMAGAILATSRSTGWCLASCSTSL